MTTTILHALFHRGETSGSRTAVQFKEHDRWRRYTWTELVNLCECIGAALLEADLQPQDRVALISNTRPEWMITDLAVLGTGAVTVPIYPNNTPEDVAFILNDSKAKVLVVEDDLQLEKWRAIQAQCPSVERVYYFFSKAPEQSAADAPRAPRPWLSLLREGRPLIKSDATRFRERAMSVKRADWATILYTSGTTGRPKGVLLTHEQVMSELEDVFRIVPVGEPDVTLTFLPFSHILGRVEAWGSVYAGYTLGFAESTEKIKQNLLDLQPTFMIAVPRIFEKLYTAILTHAQNQPLKKRLFDRALKVGRQYSRAVQEGRDPSPVLISEYSLYRQLIFNKIHAQLGGRLRFAVSGGAPLNAEICEFFHAVGLLLLEGYGLTETTAGITFNSPLKYKFGTVGPALADVELKIADDGEVLVRSKKVMKEYFGQPEQTREAFDEKGFFKTGDIGEIDADGFLRITDRKKDLIKTAGGKYVAPQRLENLLKTHPFISNVLIHGDKKKYVVALITLNEPVVRSWAKDQGIEAPDLRSLSQSPEVYAVIRDVVAAANDKLASYESIKKFTILPVDFTVETGELTPSLKVKRRVCDTKFAREIAELYNG